MATKFQLLKLSRILQFLVALQLSTVTSIDALHVNSPFRTSASKRCSRKCESEFCSVPPLMRYGKYCGVLYSGCPGEQPCDGLDACCLAHDACVGSHYYLSVECNQKFLKCIHHFKDLGGQSFQGSKCSVENVVRTMSYAIEAGVKAGKVLD